MLAPSRVVVVSTATSPYRKIASGIRSGQYRIRNAGTSGITATSAWTSFHDTTTHYRRDPSPSGAVNHILVCSLTCGLLKAIGLSIWLRLAQWTPPPPGPLVMLNPPALL